ncbi:NAD(P)H-dependent flavin oxidoreductase [Pseudactinotalea terrae]|uniref:NAD(P)H-dependent flavin oxidoreductase n=1 Tax=Pseudactinotalea terrae TaxID=1743262 RepID=UPI0012E306DC|nr:nitronate monooxygenase [Pseudactinotalea terrae]
MGAWAESLELRVPVLNAPMGGVAGGRLAAAVTAAGGLGMIGMGSTATRDGLVRALGDLDGCQRFGVGLVDWVVRQEAGLLDAALDALPVLLSVSFGAELDWVERAQERGILTAVQVPDVDGARRAEDAGVDVIVARGLEGGGHGAPEAPLAELLAPVVAAVERPVLAAGGIATAADVRAALAAGADGVWVGTTFAAAAEALTPAGAKQAMLGAGCDDTVTTRAYDRAFGWPWPERYPARVLRNTFTAAWVDADGADVVGGALDPAFTLDAAGLARLHRAVADDDPSIAPVDAGTGVGSIVDVVPAATIIARLTAGL